MCCDNWHLHEAASYNVSRWKRSVAGLCTWHLGALKCLHFHQTDKACAIMCLRYTRSDGILIFSNWGAEMGYCSGTWRWASFQTASSTERWRGISVSNLSYVSIWSPYVSVSTPQQFPTSADGSCISAGTNTRELVELVEHSFFSFAYHFCPFDIFLSHPGISHDEYGIAATGGCFIKLASGFAGAGAFNCSRLCGAYECRGASDAASPESPMSSSWTCRVTDLLYWTSRCLLLRISLNIFKIVQLSNILNDHRSCSANFRSCKRL